jgi:hypothetical protein
MRQSRTSGSAGGPGRAIAQVYPPMYWNFASSDPDDPAGNPGASKPIGISADRGPGASRKAPRRPQGRAVAAERESEPPPHPQAGTRHRFASPAHAASLNNFLQS